MFRQLIIWIDLEANGLYSFLHVPLEIGVIITDGNLEEVARKKWLVDARVGKTFEKLLADNAYVNTMHRESGLFDELVAAADDKTILRRHEVDAEMVAFIREYQPDGKVLLGGSSVHYDKKFIEQHFPQLEKIANHRLVDVSAMQTTRNVALGRDLKHGFETTGNHRVFEDLDNTLARARVLWAEERAAAEQLNQLAALCLYTSSMCRQNGVEPPAIVDDIRQTLANKSGDFPDGRSWSADENGRLVVASHG